MKGATYKAFARYLRRIRNAKLVEDIWDIVCEAEESEKFELSERNALNQYATVYEDLIDAKEEINSLWTVKII